MPRHLIDGPVDLSIGGILYHCTPEGKFAFNDPLNSYDGFLSSGVSDDCKIGVSVDACMPQGLLDGELLFDAAGAWQIREVAGKQFFVGIGPDYLEAPPWALDRTDGSWSVHGNPAVIDAQGGIVFPMMYPVDQLICVHSMAARKGMLVHCAGLELDGGAYIFAGKSGAGKSTLSECVRDIDGIDILSDDRIVVRSGEAGLRAYGTPWPGDAGFAENRGAPLKGICFIEHAEESRLNKVTSQNASERLLQVVSVPWYDAVDRDAVTAMISDTAESLPCFTFSFSPDGNAGEFLLEELGKMS